MTARMSNGWIGAIRRFLPPPVYLIVAALLFGMVEATWFGLLLSYSRTSALDGVLFIRDFLIALALFTYGLFRVLGFHPLFLREYSRWLDRTPWRDGLPLPLGPVHLAWPDLFIVGALVALLQDPREVFGPDHVRVSGLTGLMLFVQSHTVAVAFSVWLTRPRTPAYVSTFLLAFSARLSLWSPVAGMFAMAAAAAVAHWGLSQSWLLFPWPETTERAVRLKTGWRSAQQMRSGQALDDEVSPDRVPPAELGWPFGVCSPYIAPKVFETREKLLLAALLGLWIHSILAVCSQEIVAAFSGFLLIYGLLAVAITRLMSYGDKHASPINLVGRLLTLRWIIPRYDALCVGPLSIVTVALVFGLAGHFWLCVPLDILTPAVLTLTLWTACLSGPSAERWKLTAPARLVPGRLNRSRFEELS